MELGEEDAGKHVGVQVGDTVVVKLPENATTGYRWVAADGDDATVGLIDHEYRTSSAHAGAAGVHSFRFQARRPGRATIHLAHRRPWEGEDQAVKQFDITVEVAGR